MLYSAFLLKQQLNLKISTCNLYKDHYNTKYPLLDADAAMQILIVQLFMILILLQRENLLA